MRKLAISLLLAGRLLAQEQTVIGIVAKGDLYSQLLECKNEANLKKMLGNRLAIGLSGNSEIDGVLKYWAETYHPGNYEFKSEQELEKIDGKKFTRVSVVTREFDDNFTYRHFRTSLAIWSMYGRFDLNFDAMKMKKDNVVLGVDKTEKDIAGKLLQYLRVYDREITAENREYRMGISSLKGSHSKTVQTKTILVPSEYLANGLKKEDFGTRYKFEFMPSADIAAKVKDGKGLEGYAQMFIIKLKEDVNRLHIFDLNNYELLAWSYIPYNRENTKPMTSEHIKDLMEKMEKNF